MGIESEGGEGKREMHSLNSRGERKNYSSRDCDYPSRKGCLVSVSLSPRPSMQNADWIGTRLVPALDASLGGQVVSSHAVTDADEEIFLLYTLSTPEPDRLGLGQVDNKSDWLQVTIDLNDAKAPFEVCPELKIDSAPEERNKGKLKQSNSSRAKERLVGRFSTLRVCIRQDSTSLRSTGGDTGSVIWRSSLYLAEKIVRDLSEAGSGHRTRHASEAAHFLLSPGELSRSRVLELGSGTGILPLLLLSHPYLANPYTRLSWLATDQANMLPLLRKNLSPTPAHVGALDWVEASTVYRSQSDSVKQAFLRNLLEPFNSSGSDLESADLIMATDCIFNPFLFGPFVDTLNLCSVPLKTIVMVVCELREPDAMTEYLQTWLNVGRKGEQWVVHTLEGEEVLGDRLLRGSVVWAGWRLR